MTLLRRHRSIVGTFLCALMLSWQVAQPLHATTYYWDTDGSDVANDASTGNNLGGSGTWDTSTSNWWDTAALGPWVNGSSNIAVFSGPAVSVPTLNTVTLSGALTANKLEFWRSGYTLTGGTSLTFAGTNAGLFASTGDSATIASVIAGSDGLLKTGGGAIRLTGTNTYTGTTTISGGSLVISAVSALGADSSDVVVSGAVTRGFGGGQLVLEGGYSSGINFTRGLSLQGYGPLSDRSGALASVGNNTLSGAVATGVGAINTRVNSTGGTLTISGPLTINGTAGTTITTFGTINAAGIGNTSVTGALSGTGTIDHLGSGTLILSPSSATGFTGSVRVTGNAAGGVSTVRITNPSQLGAGTGNNDLSTVDLNGGTFEVRSDGGSYVKNVYNRANSTFFVDHAIGSQAINQTMTFGNYRLSTTDAQTGTFTGRNGTNLTFTGAVTPQTAATSQTITNNMNGTLTFSSTVAWGTSDATARTLTVGGSGNTIITGNLLATPGAAHIFAKGGTGTVTLNGAASTYTGATNVNGGILQIAHFGSINNNTAAVNIGTTTTGATLSIVGNNLTAAQATTSKVINLAGTTGGATILANQTGTSPALTFNANFTATGAGAKTLTLGGNNTLDNIINGIIPDSSTPTTSVTKTGPGTWVLAGANTYTGATSIVEGTLKIKANSATSTIIADSSTINLGASGNVQQSGGIFQFTGVSGSPTTEALGALAPLTGANTVRLTSGGGGAAANLTFTSLTAPAAGTGTNFDTSGAAGGTVTITGSSNTNGIVNARMYFNGADFASSSSGVIGAATYTNAASSMTAGNTQPYRITGSFTQSTATINAGIKFDTTQTLTLGASQTLTINNGANTPGAILVSGTNNALITGGTGLTTGGSGDLVIRVDGASDLLTIASVLTSGTTGGLTKNGAGVLVLSGNNAQTGATNINEGTVRLSGSGRLSGANVTTNIRAGATLDLNGVNTGTAIGQINGGGTITNSNTTAATATFGNNNGTGTFSGVIQNGAGVVNVTKTGTGAQTWSGVSTYTGVTTIGSTGIVSVPILASIGSNSGIGRGDNTSTATNAASLVFTGTSATQAYGGISYTGTSSISIDRLFTFNGGSTGGARIQNNSATNSALIFSNTNALAFGAAATGNAQGLVLGGASTGDSYFFPQITDNGAARTSVFKSDAGVWFLGNSSNSYTGNTQINGGALGFLSGALPTNSPIVFNGGQLLTSGNFTRNLVATATPGNADEVTWSAGGGFAAHDGKLIVAIGGIGSPTALTWGTGGFVATGGALILNSATALNEVEFRNAINLGTAARTIQVDDNGTTNTDFATITGIISGGAGGNLIKTGAGQLQNLGANTYLGTTEVQAGTLIVNSLGNSSTAGGSSVGQTGITMDNSNAIVLGNTTTTAGLLQYIGTGEVSDRKIRLNGTTANNQIHADGTGALILTNVAHDTTATGNKTLSLRGSNTAGNMITSSLTDNGTGVLSVTVDGGATWILSGNNTFTGTTTVSAGALGIGSNTAVGATSLTLNNGNVFAYGADRTISTTVNGANLTTTGFIGDYSLTFTQPLTILASANNYAINNNVAAGKLVEFAGATANALTAARTFTIGGNGETFFNGNITTSTAFDLNITKNNNGILTLGGTGASNWNAGTLTVTAGTLRLAANEAIPNGAGKGNVVFSPSTGASALFDLNGRTETVNGFTATTAGTITIDNTSASPAVFKFGDQDSTIAIGTGTGTYTIQNSGGGALSIVKLGNTSTTFGAGVSLNYTGATRVEGGTLTLPSALNGSTALEVINSGSTLALTGGITTPSAITSVVVQNGGTLNLLDGVGNQLNALTNLQLGSSGGTMTTLNLNVGDGPTAGDNLNTDLLSLITGGTLNLFSGNQITFNLTDAGLNPNQQYVLLDATAIGGGLFGGASPLSLTDYILGGVPGGFTSLDLTTNSTTNQIILTTGNLIIGSLYWRGLSGGGTNNTWNANVNNWSQDKANTSVATSLPGQGTDVIFAINSASGAVTTTLEQNFKINSLTFEAGTSTPTSVTIAPGTVSTNRLEIAPQVATAGIAITSGGPPAVTISAPLRLGKNQTWNIVDSASTLTLSGGLQGEADVTKSGAGKVTLSAAADPTFNAGTTTDITVNAGTLEMTVVSALGTVANSNLANVVISGGGFYYNNATAGTVPNPITLSGGALSGAANNHTYSGAISVSSASTVNMADSNGPVSATARNITLSGIISGSGGITVDSNNAVSSGNQIGGTLTINNASNTWSGSLSLNRGTVTFTSAASPAFTANDVIFNTFGRLILQGANGTSLTRTGTLTYAAGSVGEFQVDNAAGTPTLDYIVDQTGAIAIGSGGTGASVRVWLADDFSKATFSGGVTLGGNSSISAGGAAGRLLAITGLITDGGNNYSLAINDDAGGWGATNGIVRITGNNTYTGGTSLTEGHLSFGHKNAIGSGTFTIAGTSTLSAFTTLTGTNAVANSIAQNANYTFVGSNSLELSGAVNMGAAARTITVNGDTGATLTLSGAITNLATADGTALTLAGNATGTGVITGGFTMTGIVADMAVTGGNWTLSGATSTVADDLTVSGTGVLNLNSTSALAFGASADASLRANAGGTINLGANNAVVVTDFDGLRIGTDAAGTGTFNLNTFNQGVTELILGNRQSDRLGMINGTGTLTVSGNLDLYGGTVNANLASTGSTAFEKFSLNTVTLAGDNSGLASTGASILYEGTLILDYTVSNTTKLRAASTLEMRGGILEMVGNASAATSQTVGGLTLASGFGNSTITLTPSGGQDILLTLGALTRAVNTRAGTLRINLPSGTQSATNGVTTTTGLTNGLVGTAGYLTVADATGTWFATKSGNNIVPLASTATNAVGSWVTGEHITDSGSGFTGTVSNAYLNSLRFDAAAGSDLSLGTSGVLGIASGGILITNNVGSTPSIMGGTIFSGALASNVPELIITHDGVTVFELGSDFRTNSAFTKSGAGTLLLSGNNTATGDFTVLEGTVRLTGGNAIGDTSRVTLANHRPTTIQLLADETFGRLEGGQRQTNGDWGIVDVGSNTLTINQSANTTYSGVFTGTGTIVLSATSTSNLATVGFSTGFTGSVIANGGLFHLSGAGSNSATSFTLNNLSGLLMDKNGVTTSGDQVSNSAAINLNSAIGNQTVAGGLWIRRDQGSTQSETVGVITAASGASYVRAETSAANAITILSASTVQRDNNATLIVRGNNMDTTSGRRAHLRIIAGNEAAFISTMTGAGGASGTVTTSIVPWVIAQDNGNGTITADNMGNSLATYTTTSGFRPLNFTTEYATYATAGATNNTRESRTTDVTGLAGRTLNSLVIDNNNTATINITGSGAGQTLTNTSGAFLFTISNGVASTAYSTILGGFDSGIAVGGSEYIFHVVNPSYAATTSTLTTTINSPLTSSADITKSGRGTLILTQNNTAGGGSRKTTLNEGVLEIADLDNIGGNTGALVFAGGTLRLGTGFADDLTDRTISFLTGGATLDTNGIDITFANSLGSGVGGFTKIGAGNLTLNGTATYTGATVLTTGTFTIGASNALGNGGNLSLAGGTTLALGSSSLSHGLVTTSGASPAITGTGTITASQGFLFNHTGDTTINAVLAGSGGVFKSQTNNLTLDGASTYTGTTEVQAGTLTFTSVTNVGGGSSALGAPTNAENGIIRMGLTTAATTLAYTGSGHSTDRLIGMQGTTGGVTLRGDGTGAIGYGGARFENAGNKTLTLRGSSDPALVNTIGALTELGGVLTLNKTDANTWQINGASSYTGATQVDNGILRIGVNNALPVTTAVRLGTGTTAGILDLNGFNQTVGALTVETNSSTAINQLIVDSGNTFTVNGAVTMGANTGAGANTRFEATGGGSFVNTNIGGTFQIGGGTGGTNTSNTIADFSGLANFTVNLGATGIFRVGDANTNSSGSPASSSILTLASTSASITAGTINLGQGTGQGNADQTLKLGAGTNTLNADTINIGGNTTRSGGSLEFAGSSGSVTIRASDGVGAADVNMVNGNINTGIANQTDFLLAGHMADVLIGFMTMAAKSANSGTTTANFTFDQGTLDITSLRMTRNTGAYAGTATSNVTLGGGSTTIGTLEMAVNTSSAASTANATFNVTGGTVTIGTGSGTAINMANAGTGRTSTANINLTGGTVDVTGNVIRTGGAGTENTTVTLNGATLDMNGFSIGTSAAAITFAAQSGTLENLAELNGGTTPLTKTTAGTLIMQGNNTYTGGTNINGGVLQVNSSGALGTTGTISFGGGTLQYTTNNTTDYSSRFSTAASQAYSIDTNGQSVTFASDLSSSGGTLTKLGTGTLVLTAANTYSGSTTVSGGTLQVGDGTSGSLAGTGSVGISSGATLSGSGSIAGAVTVNAGGFLAPGVGNVATSNETLTLSHSGGLTVADGGQVTISITNPSNASLLTFENGQYVYNSNTYATAAALFGAEPTALATWNTSPAAVSNHDFINITTGGLSLGTRGSAGYGNGTFVVTDNGFLSGSPAYGQVFNLIDWMGAMTGTFSVGGATFGNSGTFGDLDLPTLTGGLAWDVTAFTSYGIVVVVPEPGRVILLLLGLLGFLMRRRRA